jgi:ClpP class serine protease
MDGKITHQSLVAMLNGHPFPMTEAGLWVVTAIASRQAISADLLREYRSHADLKPPTAFMVSAGKPVERGSSLRLRENGVAVLPIRGPMIRHGDLFDEISGAASMSSMAKDLGLALSSSDVMSLVLDIESPGGEIPAELAEMIRQTDAQKPVTAYIGNWGMSAAYWAATGASRVVAHRTAYVGSVGVRAIFYDTTQMEESLGIKRIEMMASQSPAKISDPANPEGRARIQAILDSTADDFIGDVASYLKVSKKKVREDFGQGAAVAAKPAAEIGMIHALDTMEGVIAAVGGGRRYKSSSISVGSSSPTGSSAMAKTFGEWLGTMWNKPVPAHLEGSPETETSGYLVEAAQDAPSSSGSASQSGDEDPTELKRQLAAARAELSRQADQNLEARVSGWVGKHIHPHQKAGVLAHCRKLAEADRRLNTPAADSILAHYIAHMEAQDMGLLSDAVVQGKVPAGGRIEKPPVSPDAPTEADPWASSRAAMEKKPDGAAANGVHK